MAVTMPEYSLYPNSAREFIVADLKATPGSTGTGREAYCAISEIAWRHLPKMARSDASIDQLCELMMVYWSERCKPQFDEETLRGYLAQSMVSFWEAKKIEDAQRKAERQRADKARSKVAADKASAERVAEESKAESSRLNRVIAKEFGISVRQALNLRREGTIHRGRAVRLAEILGTEPEAHLRKTRRRGRQLDVVQFFMGVELSDVTFRRFLTDEATEGVPNVLIEFLWSHADRFADMRSLEDLIQQIQILGFQPISLVLVHDVWKSYKIWRIRTISSIAMYDVEEGYTRVSNGQMF